ncbi:MAG: MFS transporter [Candidatus Ratteibacteria bacterium]|jgi:MFS family permease
MTIRDFFRKKVGVSRNVFALGIVSFFNDIASEMLYPVVPIFLTTVLGAPVAVVGLIEGIAESTASILKVVSGWFSDRFRSRKPFLVGGYSCSALSKVLLGLAYSWPLVLLARFVDRFGKGIRTSARDALIVESTKVGKGQGRSFGFHRGMDTAGATLGPLFTILLLRHFKDNLRPIFFLAFIPALLGILFLLFFVKEKKKETKRFIFTFRWRELDRSFKVFLLVSFVFALGNSSDVFLILRAKNLGLSTILTILAYVLYNLTYALFSFPAGIVSDRIGPKKVLVSGFLIFSVVYLFFGIATRSFFLWLLFPVYGIYMAFTEGIGKAYIAGLVPSAKAGTAFGFYQTVTGVCIFFASLLAGLLWTYVSPRSPFIFGSVTALTACIIFIVWEKREC